MIFLFVGIQAWFSNDNMIFLHLESYGFFDGVEDVEAVLPDIMKQYNQGLLSQYGHIFTTSIR